MSKDKKLDKKEENKGDSKDIYPKMTDEEVKKLAEDMYKGYVFTDKHIQIAEEIQIVFAPLIFIGEEQIKQMRENPPGMIYEYMDKAGPRSINGMPMFMSVKMASIEDTKRVFAYYNKIKSAIANV